MKIYSDGASRGNPGPSAIAFMILDEDEKILKRFSRYVGVRTNNQAEYEALVRALESASELNGQEVACHLDSELVIKHLNGEYRVRNPNLKRLWLRVKELEKRFERLSFTHVSREETYMKMVDSLANQTLDRATC